MQNDGRYTRYLDVLIALVTYLALTPNKSRTAPNLAIDLSLPLTDVEGTFDQFPGLFRRSKNTSAEGLHYYTLHGRYALRTDTDGEVQVEMRPELLQAMLTFVSQRAEAEASQERFHKTLNQAKTNAGIAAVASVLAAVAAIAAAIVGA